MHLSQFKNLAAVPQDFEVEAAVVSSVYSGWNVIDSARNYRNGRGELCAGYANLEKYMCNTMSTGL